MNSPAPQHGPTPPPLPEPVAASPLKVVVADDNPVVRAGLTALLSGRDEIQVVAEAADGRQAFDVARQHSPDVILLDVRMPGVDGLSALPHLVLLAPVLMLTYSRESEVVHEALRLGAGGYLVHGEFTADQLIAAVRDVKDGKAHFSATASNTLLAQMRGGPPSAGLHPPSADPSGGQYMASEPPSSGHAHAYSHPGHNPRPGASDLQSLVRSSALNPPQFPTHSSQRQSSMASSSREQQPRGGRYGLSSREAEIMEHIAAGMSNAQIAATCFVAEKTVKNHINRIFTKLQAASRSEAIAVWLGTVRGGND
ncbi:response regulator transcription factor [Streptomyces gobiensis]|nr:response regulator transcription factor [Streptomyces gobiensis]UGY95200.1 response regulator transcription factor [Streptomyces gobiensis]